jgi:F-type H+-transporting ATPase subunit alpha
MPVEEQVVSIFAGTRGHLDDIPVNEVRRFERELLEFMRTRHGSLLDELRTGAVPDALGDAIGAFKQEFVASIAAAARQAADPTATDADELGEAASRKTLATE